MGRLSMSTRVGRRDRKRTDVARRAENKRRTDARVPGLVITLRLKVNCRYVCSAEHNRRPPLPSRHDVERYHRRDNIVKVRRRVDPLPRHDGAERVVEVDSRVARPHDDVAVGGAALARRARREGGVVALVQFPREELNADESEHEPDQHEDNCDVDE